MHHFRTRLLLKQITSNITCCRTSIEKHQSIFEYENFAIEGYTVAQRSIFVIEADGTIDAWYAETPETSMKS